MFNHNNFKSKHKKTKILMYPGGMINNGITSSAINLLDNIDYDQYDVTIFLGYTRNLEVLNNIKTVNPNVRIMFRYGPLLATTIEKYQDTFIKNRVYNPKLKKNFIQLNFMKESLERYLVFLNLMLLLISVDIQCFGLRFYWEQILKRN